ncbi:hypothetical protein FRC01_006098, partial [Tulasnella sp. 417]
MTRTRTEGGTEDAPYLRLKQLGKDDHVKISDRPLDLEEWPGRVSLFSVNNKFAYFAAGCNNAFLVSPIQSLRDHYGSDALYEPQYLNTLKSPPVILKFTSDGERLIVGTRDGRISVYSTPRNSPDWSAASSSNAAALPLLYEFAHSTEPVKDIQPNPHDRPEIVAVLRGSSNGPSFVEFLDTSNNAVQQSIRGGPGSQHQTAVSWSPKGKQLVIGDRSGQLTQYGLDREIKASIPAPDQGQAREVVSVAWLENSIFVIAYRSPEDGEDLPLFVINHDSKTGTTTEVTLEDPSPPFGMQSREPARTFVHLRSWEPMKHLLFVSDAPSDEVGAVACLGDANPRWAKLDLDETARASAPLAEDGSPSSIVGMDLDLTSTAPIKSDSPDEEPTPAAPILLAYSSEGTVLAYHVLNTTTPTFPSMMPFDPSRVGAPAPSPHPHLVPVPAAASTAPALLPFGATSGSSANPTFGFGASVPALGATAFGSTTPTVTPNKPAFGQPAFGATTTPAFGQPAFGATTTPAFGTTPKATFGAPAFGAPAFGAPAFGATSTPPAFGKPAFGQTGFGAAASAPAFSGFGAVSQNTAFGQSGFGFGGGISTTPVQTPPAAGSGASRPAASKAPGLESPSSTPPSTPQPKVPAPNFGSTGFSAFNPSSTTPTTTPNPFAAAAAQPKKSLEILPSSGAFGQASGTPSAFGSFGNAPKPAAFSLPKQDGPSASTTTPSFGATTSFGTTGFGAPSAPKPTSSVPPIKVGTGGGFAGFGGSSGFGGFGGAAAKTGTQNIFGGTSSTPPAIKVEPAETPKSAFLFGNASKPPASQSGFGNSRGPQDTADEEEEPERKERFPESENDNKEPTQSNLDFFAPQSGSGSDGASSTTFSYMSLGTARPQSQATTPGIQIAFAPATPSKSPQSAIPMSTTTTVFPGPLTPSGPSPVRTPMQEEKPISPANNQEEVGEEDATEDGEGVEEEEEEQEEEPFVVSAPQSTDGEGEGSGTDEEEEPSAETDSSYVFAEIPDARSPSADGATTPRADRRPSPADSTTPVISPVRANPETGFSSAFSLPSPPNGANRPEASSGGFSFGRTTPGVRGKSPFASAPVVSSPLANPPISGPSPTKSAAESSADTDPDTSFPNLPKQTGKVMQMPMPADDDKKKPAARSKTPPLPFGLGGASSKPKPPTGLFSGAPVPSLFGAPPAQSVSPVEAPKPTPGLSAPKPVLGGPGFSFGPATSTAPKPLSNFGFGQPPTAGFGQPPTTGFGQPPATGAVKPPPVPSTFGNFGQPNGPGVPSTAVPPSRIPVPVGSVPMGSVPAVRPSTPAQKMEALFVEIINTMAQNLDVLRKEVADTKVRQLRLKQKVPKAPGQDLGTAENWTFNDLKSIRVIALSFQDNIDAVNQDILEMKRQIALIQSISLKTETRHEEIRRFLDAAQDPKMAELVGNRGLGPEQEEYQARLSHLCQVVTERVEQLELIVEDEKKKVERAKVGRTTMQVPTLELVTRSLKRVTSAAKTRLDDLERLQRRIEVLASTVEEPLFDSPNVMRQSPSLPPLSSTASLSAIVPVRSASFTGIKGKGTRNSVDFEARAAAAAALHAET